MLRLGLRAEHPTNNVSVDFAPEEQVADGKNRNDDDKHFELPKLLLHGRMGNQGGQEEQSLGTKDMSNPSTVPMLSPDGQIGDVPQEQAGAAAQSGFKMAQDMLSPDGQPGVIPFDQVHQALAKGFQLKGSPVKSPAAAEDVEPEKMSGWQGLRAKLADFFRLDMPKEEDQERALAPLKSAANVGEGIVADTVGNAAKASAPNVLYQLYKHFKGEPNDLNKIPAAGVMTFLASLGDPESAEGSTVSQAADPIGATTTKVARGLQKVRQLWKSSDAAVEDVAHGGEEEGNPQSEFSQLRKTKDFGTPQELRGTRISKEGQQAEALKTGGRPGEDRAAGLGKIPYKGEPAAEPDPDAKDIPQEEWDAGHEIDTKPDNSEKPAPTAGQKAAAEKAFLEHLGVSKEDITAAKQKQALAYQKHLTKAAVKGVQFGPKGGVTPELMEGAKAAGRQAYLKHLGIDEMKLEEAKSASRQGAMSHYKQAMADLTKKPGKTPKTPAP